MAIAFKNSVGNPVLEVTESIPLVKSIFSDLRDDCIHGSGNAALRRNRLELSHRRKIVKDKLELVVVL